MQKSENITAKVFVFFYMFCLRRGINIVIKIEPADICIDPCVMWLSHCTCILSYFVGLIVYTVGLLYTYWETHSQTCLFLPPMQTIAYIYSSTAHYPKPDVRQSVSVLRTS